MKQAERFKLRFGKYRTPRFRIGAVVKCERRGEMRIVRISNGRIPWPVGRPLHGACKSPSLVLYKGLARAVRLEANLAVRYWWGVAPTTVWKWRRTLGTSPNNRGTLKLRQRYGEEPWFRRAQRKAWSKAGEPERREKIAAALRGQKRPRRVVAIVSSKLRGRKHCAEVRRKMSMAHKARGTRPPWVNPAWQPWEDELVGTLRPSEAAAQTGRTLSAVNNRRYILGVPDARRRNRPVVD